MNDQLFTFTSIYAMLTFMLIGSNSYAESTTPIKGITGEISNISYPIPAQDSIKPIEQGLEPSDINLKRMAQWSLRYLVQSPRKHLNYDPVFQCFTFQCPPAPEGADPIVPCDTDARMDWEWYYMRDITGSDYGRDVEKAFHKRMRGYISDEGYVWCAPGAYNEGDINAIYEEKDKIIHIWGTTKIIKSLSEDYKRTKNPESKELAQKIIHKLKEFVVWEENGCYIPCGHGGMRQDGTVALPSSLHAPIVEPLLTYWEATGDKDGLDFAKAYADGMINGLMPGGVKFAEDGNIGMGHGHITMHAVWGIARLGVVLNDHKYTDFAKRVWDWMLSRGTGTGWFPAAPEWAEYGTEVCLISDMMSTASHIAQAGYPEYYDYIERYMRNYIANLQFIATPEFEEKYRLVNKDLPKEEVEKGLEQVRTFQGGFYNAGLSDFENTLLGGGGYIFKIAGCCAPEGIRAVYTSWLNTITRNPKSALGPAGVYVNMSFTRKSEWCDTISYLPTTGRLTVKAKIKDDFYIRPPHWAPKESVKAFKNNDSVDVKWSNDYIRFTAEPGDELTITYPIVRFHHEVSGLWPKSGPNLTMKFQWEGNEVVNVHPRPAIDKTPLFLGKHREIPPVDYE